MYFIAFLNVTSMCCCDKEQCFKSLCLKVSVEPGILCCLSVNRLVGLVEECGVLVMAYVVFACTLAPTNYPGIYTDTDAVLDHILALTPGPRSVSLPLPKPLTAKMAPLKHNCLCFSTHYSVFN